MDKAKLADAINAVLAFFPNAPDNDWRHEGQTFCERVEGYVLHAIEELENEMACPDEPDDDEDAE